MEQQDRHPDRWLFLMAYPLIALAVIHVGNDNSLRTLLGQASYYSDLLLSLALTYAAGLYFRWYYRNHPLPGGITSEHRARLGEYLLSVFILPIAFLAAVEYCYVSLLLGIPLAEITLFYLELPIIALFCLLINAFYLIVGLGRATNRPEQPPGLLHRDHFLVHAGAATRRVETDRIAYFQVVEKTTFLVEPDGGRSILALPLREVEAVCDPDYFFPINRQVLAHRDSVRGFERTDTRKLLVHLDPPSGTEQYVSKTKATGFVSWLEKIPSASESNRAASAE